MKHKIPGIYKIPGIFLQISMAATMKKTVLFGFIFENPLENGGLTTRNPSMFGTARIVFASFYRNTKAKKSFAAFNQG